MMYSPLGRRVKRAFDIGASLVGLAATAPVLVATAALVKLSSPGPVIFRQTRVGRGGKSFQLLKFRTQVTVDRDPRITAVGRVLRKTKLDELPELLNVLRGDLSLVGPRPEVPKYVAMYPDAERAFLQRFQPGITDPATIRFRNEEDVLAGSADPEATYVEEILPAKLRMYREYLEGATVASDLRVIAETAIVVLMPGRAER
jgi:lipopolysaccharide/colanic/teichoic acid biosynthesis glycosyltransferase